jgi:drug/metabolite transporter (DMT)-like permease
LGAGLLLLASLLWGSYTLGLRRTGLDAIGCTLLLSLPSLAFLVIAILTGAVETHIGQFSLAQAAPFLLVQGLGVGVVASLAYAFAIARLGPARSAVIGSSPRRSPAFLAAAAGRGTDAAILIGVAAITAGVVRANRC